MQSCSYEVVNLSSESTMAKSYDNHSIAKVNDHEVRISTMTEANVGIVIPTPMRVFWHWKAAFLLILTIELSNSCQGR